MEAKLDLRTVTLDEAEATVAAITAGGGTAFRLAADLSDLTAGADLVARAIDALGGLDILVNNAGVAAMAPIDQFTLEDFDRSIAINVRGLFVAMSTCTPMMLRPLSLNCSLSFMSTGISATQGPHQ